MPSLLAGSEPRPRQKSNTAQGPPPTATLHIPCGEGPSLGPGSAGHSTHRGWETRRHLPDLLGLRVCAEQGVSLPGLLGIPPHPPSQGRGGKGWGRRVPKLPGIHVNGRSQAHVHRSEGGARVGGLLGGPSPSLRSHSHASPAWVLGLVVSLLAQLRDPKSQPAGLPWPLRHQHAWPSGGGPGKASPLVLEPRVLLKGHSAHFYASACCGERHRLRRPPVRLEVPAGVPKCEKAVSLRRARPASRANSSR